METNENIRYNANEEPIVLSKHLLDILLKQENPSDLIGLYTFYYYTAKWQKTNQIKATTNYVSNALSWGLERVRKTKSTLRELGLIEDAQDKDKNNLFGDRYIIVHFIWSKSRTSEYREYGEIPVPRFSRTTGKSYTNALSANTKNALSANKGFLNASAKEESLSKESKIIPPTLKMITTHCKEKRSSVDPETFFNFYQAKGWFIGKNKMKDWHCALATWEKKDRSESGYIPNKGYKRNSCGYNEPDELADKFKKTRSL